MRAPIPRGYLHPKRHRMQVVERSTRRTFASKRTSALVISLVIGLLCARQWKLLSTVGDGLSETADPWTEADTVRAAEGYYLLGFRANCGLPDICFGEQFPDHGTKQMLRDDRRAHAAWESSTLRGRVQSVTTDHFVYTHYPPGPHWIAGLATKLFGLGHLKEYRLFPIVVGLLATSYFGWELCRYFNVVLGSIGLVSVAALPMFSTMMHGLSYQGYALSLLLMELGLCLRMRVTGATRVSHLLVLVVLAHLQGWLGFDYCFLVVLAPWVVWLVLYEPRCPWRTAAMASLVIAAGFCSAHILHFAEVSACMRSVNDALLDMLSAAEYRSVGGILDNGAPVGARWPLLMFYLTEGTGSAAQFGAPIGTLTAAGAFATLIIRDGQQRSMLVVPMVALLVAMTVSSLWVVTMPQHAMQHVHFIPRHYFLSFFASLLAVLEALRGVPREPIASS